MGKVPRGWDTIMPRGRKRPVRNGWRSAPAGKKRLLIKEKTESRIRDIIEDWKEPKITWAAVVQVVNLEFKGNWTRVAIAKHPKLQKAFRDTKKRLRALEGKATGRQRKAEGDGTVEVLKKHVRSLREENQKLRATNATLEERYVRWKTNAYLNGWSIKKLDEKLDKPDRGQTDKDR
ncbi:hypothetical protein XI09_04665 [Bradyrhizobium sp. CCBAU 11386]|uniref:hypothetical protein n=1 Tax=Bradyrhizobium sp. CCBAU 11386 TaxID=1630837 RepID=UPI0023048182|nr:hypothetical protein [Bradyrhizobium sp. CCBAU 11386]MDA9504068.1 hypothetical protein [Bradyrhizobium sp. CCBAU 11386]